MNIIIYGDSQYAVSVTAKRPNKVPSNSVNAAIIESCHTLQHSIRNICNNQLHIPIDTLSIQYVSDKSKVLSLSMLHTLSQSAAKNLGSASSSSSNGQRKRKAQ
jgi:hypothetical protein